MSKLKQIEIKNFRSLAEIKLETSILNVLFGPNGAGKSAFLDTLWFIRDCAIRGADQASSDRSHGIGLMWERADMGTDISVKIETISAEYEVILGYSSGRIETFVGERLLSKNENILLMNRKIGSDKAIVYDSSMNTFTLREPEKLALTPYRSLTENSVAAEIDELLRRMDFFYARYFNFYGLRRFGSESDRHISLRDRAQNLWSVLRNLKDRREVDNRYDTVIRFMRKSFPSFRELLIEQIGQNVVYGNFLEENRRNPIRASGVSDGHLQMLILLTALFSEENQERLILFDEPETSLHPYAISVFAEAVRFATEQCNRQIFIATHSPVLLSQFEPQNIIAVEIGENGCTMMKRVSEMKSIGDLLEQYAAGSLYMAEMIAPQSKRLTEEEIG